MGILSAFKKKKEELPVNDLPPLPKQFETTNASLDEQLPSSFTQDTGALSSAQEPDLQQEDNISTASPVQETAELALTEQPAVEQQLEPIIETTEPEKPVEVAVKEPQPLAAQEKSLEPEADPFMESTHPETQKFAIPENYDDLVPEEIFINRHDYITFLGNLDLLKEQLLSEKDAVHTTDNSLEVLQKGVQQSLACEATMTKIESKLSYQGDL